LGDKKGIQPAHKTHAAYPLNFLLGARKKTEENRQTQVYLEDWNAVVRTEMVAVI